jgi:preprotein translocase subunit SecG
VSDLEETAPVLTAITATLNVISSLIMIVLVLLHSGKGGGLSDMFGGGMGASAMGSTVMERNLDRITVVVALIWAFTVAALSLMLG